MKLLVRILVIIFIFNFSIKSYSATISEFPVAVLSPEYRCEYLISKTRVFIRSFYAYSSVLRELKSDSPKRFILARFILHYSYGYLFDSNKLESEEFIKKFSIFYTDRDLSENSNGNYQCVYNSKNIEIYFFGESGGLKIGLSFFANNYAISFIQFVD